MRQTDQYCITLKEAVSALLMTFNDLSALSHTTQFWLVRESIFSKVLLFQACCQYPQIHGRQLYSRNIRQFHIRNKYEKLSFTDMLYCEI